MKKKVLLIIFIIIANILYSQKKQTIAYVDMEYILQNIPEYTKAQNSLNIKVQKWKDKLDKEEKKIEILKIDLANEKAILTKDLIQEREEDIKIKIQALNSLEALYFGPEGEMYNLRKKLIEPVQDQVYNVIQNIAKRKKYDFVFNKSSDLVMLYLNKKYDISALVVKLIKINQKKQSRIDQIAERKKLLNESEMSENQKKKIATKIAKKIELENKRQEKLKAVEEKRKLLKEKRRLLKEKRDSYKKAKEEKMKLNK